MKTKLKFLFICLVWTTILYGASYNGRVLDNKGKPLKHAVVINTANHSADITDEDGTFSINASNGDPLLINHWRGEERSIIFKESMKDIVLHIVDFYESRNIEEKDIDLIQKLYLAQRFRDCIAHCMYYVDEFIIEDLLSSKHPYKDWGKSFSWTGYSAKDVANVLYIGSSACYEYSRLGDNTFLVWGMLWSQTCAAIYASYLQERTPNKYSSANEMYEYITYGERGETACAYGQHFLKPLDEDGEWVKEQKNWFNTKNKQISALLYIYTKNRDVDYPNYPLLQYKIDMIAIRSEDIADKREEYFKIKNAVIRYIERSAPNFAAEIFRAIGSLTSFLTQIAATALDEEIRRSFKGDLDRFCMEELIKLQDISYYLNGSSVYSLYPNYSLRDIQNHLKNDECAIMHFEAPVAGGYLYSRYDLGTLYRNYAYVITKNQETPTLWHRGYIDDKKVNDLSKIKAQNPSIKKFYFVGTPRMSFIDIAGKDPSIVRLHSLSQLLQNQNTNFIAQNVTFIGDINYWIVGNAYSGYDNTKGSTYGTLRGPAQELKQIKSLFNDNVSPISGDNATKEKVKNALAHNKGIVHISTHGTTSFDPDKDFAVEDLILNRNVMENSGLILSGYNDNPQSPSSHISGADILSIKRVNSPIVFLDACSSGKGAVGVSGSVGIAEAFHLVGVKNVICYLSDINDDLATRFCNIFYKEISKGVPCHDAFFTAKQSFNENIDVILWE